MRERVAAEQAAVGVERRAFVRVTSHLAADCKPVGLGQVMSWPGDVRDISRGGVCLRLRHRFRPGTRLTVELRDPSNAFLHTVQVRVVRVTAVLAHGNHAWLLGCAIDPPLDDATWAALT